MLSDFGNDVLEQVDQKRPSGSLQRECSSRLPTKGECSRGNDRPGINQWFYVVSRSTPGLALLQNREAITTYAFEFGKGSGMEVDATKPRKSNERRLDALPE